MEKTEKMMSAEEFEQNIAIYEQMVKEELKAQTKHQSKRISHRNKARLNENEKV